MNSIKEKIKGTLIVPFGLAIVIVPYSLIIGWNLLTLFLFWFVITPALATFLPSIFSKSYNHLLESLVGLVVFYGLVVFMIYDHYQSDYFKIMMTSCVMNLFLVAVFTFPKMRWLR